ncbi:MAG: NAD(P)H-dependent oxidoreductase subunit E, partial [Chloroflexota bacterium]
MARELGEILAPHRGERGALIPILQKAQSTLGYLPEDALSEIAAALRMSLSEVYGVLTFYAQFRTKPIGRNVVKVCRGTACHVRDGARVLAEVERQLGVEAGDTTPDLEYSVETVACLGCCALAPTIV